MDFLKILRSFEELMYEVMTWLLFYPRTLLRVLTQPQATLDYAMAEQGDEPDDQFVDTLSPPLFLLLTLGLCYIAARVVHAGAPSPPIKTGMLASLLHSGQGTLIARSLLFSVFPLAFATEHVRRSENELNRKTLRPAFFAQCFLAGVFVLAVSGGAVWLGQPDSTSRLAGGSAMLIGSVWYIAVNAVWLRRQFGLSRLAATLTSARCFALATALVIAIAAFLIIAPPP